MCWERLTQRVCERGRSRNNLCVCVCVCVCVCMCEGVSTPCSSLDWHSTHPLSSPSHHVCPSVLLLLSRFLLLFLTGSYGRGGGTLWSLGPRPYLPRHELTGRFVLRVYELHGEMADVDRAEPSGRRGQCFWIWVGRWAWCKRWRRNTAHGLPEGPWLSFRSFIGWEMEPGKHKTMETPKSLSMWG